MRHIVPLALVLVTTSAWSATPQSLLDEYTAAAQRDDKSFTAADPERGKSIYSTAKQHSNGEQSACATCHTDNPTQTGSHHKTKKAIEPLAPSANPKRFTDSAKVEKWFKRNCNDVLERTCTNAEKADFLSYLLSVK